MTCAAIKLWHRSVKTLFWAMLLLGIVIFIFGVTFMQLAYNHLRTNPDNSDIMMYYGTLGRCLALTCLDSLASPTMPALYYRNEGQVLPGVGVKPRILSSLLWIRPHLAALVFNWFQLWSTFLSSPQFFSQYSKVFHLFPPQLNSFHFFPPLLNSSCLFPPLLNDPHASSQIVSALFTSTSVFSALPASSHPC